MKNLFPLLILLFLSSLSSSAQTLSYHLAKADSLFQKKRYTQSMDLYQSILQKRQFTPAMLLKMAYMEEGLDHISKSMYYLNLYYLATKDERAAMKITELASKHNLSGYDFSDQERFLSFYSGHHLHITMLFGVVIVFLVSLMIYERRKRKVRPVGSAVLMLVSAILLFVHTNFDFGYHAAIISQPNTYLMSGPSAGASVVRIVTDGHRVDVVGEHDIWAKVRWNEKEVYVKKDHLLPVTL